MRRVRVLLRSLPPDAACRRSDGRTPHWGQTEELLALLLEELSVLTSDHRRPKPLDLPRPGRQKRNPPGSVGFLEFGRMLAAAGRVRVVKDSDAAGAG